LRAAAAFLPALPAFLQFRGVRAEPLIVAVSAAGEEENSMSVDVDFFPSARARLHSKRS